MQQMRFCQGTIYRAPTPPLFYNLVELTSYRIWPCALKKWNEINMELQISMPIDCAHFAIFPTQATWLLVVAIAMFVPGATNMMLHRCIEAFKSAFQRLSIMEDNTNHNEHL